MIPCRVFSVEDEIRDLLDYEEFEQLIARVAVRYADHLAALGWVACLDSSCVLANFRMHYTEVARATTPSTKSASTPIDALEGLLKRFNAGGGFEKLRRTTGGSFR